MKISKKGLSLQEEARWEWAVIHTHPKWFRWTFYCLSAIGLVSEIVLGVVWFGKLYFLVGLGVIVVAFIWSLGRRLFFDRKASKMTYEQIRTDLASATRH
jgi:hypothetical protein